MTLGTAGIRDNQFANVTIQDDGHLKLETDYSDVGDIWTLVVSITYYY